MERRRPGKGVAGKDDLQHYSSLEEGDGKGGDESNEKRKSREGGVGV